MSSIWMGIAPNPEEVRVLAMRGADQTILKARLRADPMHPRSMQLLIEAIALWQGMPVRAALVADDTSNGYDTTFFQEAFLDFGNTPLYTLDWTSLEAHRRRRRRDIGGMGEFDDIRRLLLSEVAR
jgi:hypothetical protein